MFHTVVVIDSIGAWRAPIAGFISDFLNVGYNLSSGILLLGIQDDYDVPPELMLPTILISTGLMLMLSPATEWLSVNIGSKVSALIATFLTSLSLILLFFVPITGASVLVLLGFCHGIGKGFVHFLVAKYTIASFRKRRGVATSVQKIGASIGAFLFPPIYALLLDIYGVRISALLIGGIFLNLFLVVLLIPSVIIDDKTGRRLTSLPKLQCCRNSDQTPDAGEWQTDEGNKLVHKKTTMIKEPLLVNKRYLCFACVILLIGISIGIIGRTVLALFADEFGFSKYMIAAVLSTRSGLDTVGRFLSGFVFDRLGKRGKLFFLSAMQVVGTIGLLSLFFSYKDPVIVIFIYVACFALSDSYLTTGWIQIVAILSGNVFMGRVISGILFACGVTAISISFGFGELRQILGTYRPIYNYLTACATICAFGFFTMAVLLPRCTSRDAHRAEEIHLDEVEN